MKKTVLSDKPKDGSSCSREDPIQFSKQSCLFSMMKKPLEDGLKNLLAETGPEYLRH